MSTEKTTPVEVGSNLGLGSLPKAAHRGPTGTGSYFDAYTADQMLTYAAQQVAAERERWAPLLRTAGRVLQAADDGYLQPARETLQAGLAVDALREACGALAPARIRGPGSGLNAGMPAPRVLVPASRSS